MATNGLPEKPSMDCPLCGGPIFNANWKPDTGFPMRGWFASDCPCMPNPLRAWSMKDEDGRYYLELHTREGAKVLLRIVQETVSGVPHWMFEKVEPAVRPLPAALSLLLDGRK